ncbi:uncharacterized protein [Pocillopora verrucosa]|uniref:uncharacterized protein n=1 Tax=Pocillopora verrucosa TaxID=203993 RepID=UPI003342D50B
MAEASSLPEEIWFHIIVYLVHIQDILNLGCTSRRLLEITNQNVVWKRRFKGNNDHLLQLHLNTRYDEVATSNELNEESANFDVKPGFWKKLYLRASHALSFKNRRRGWFSSVEGERLCAEFVTNPRGPENRRAINGIRFDDRAPKKQSIELWVKLNTKKPDGIIIGCQSESVRTSRWPQYHWQILHVGPDGHIRGSLEPYKYMKGPCINNGQWHHIALAASSDWQCMFVNGRKVCSINFGIGHELHRHYMKYSQIGNGVISHGVCTPWSDDAMPRGHCGWYPFNGLVREVRIWSCMLSESTVRRNMHVQRIDLAQSTSHGHDSNALIGYWPMNRLMSGPWPWQGSLVSCTSHLEPHREKHVQLCIVCASLV